MGDGIRIRRARVEDCGRLAQMFAALWPSTTAEEHGNEARSIVDGTAKLTMPITVLVAEAENEGVVGFVEVDDGDGGGGGYWTHERHRRQPPT